MTDKQTELLEKLADKLGVTADHLWHVLVKQAPISATTDLVLFGLILTGLGLSFYGLRRAIKKENEDGDDFSTFCIIAAIGCMILFGILTIICTCCLDMTLSGFFNPEYWAFKQIVK